MLCAEVGSQERRRKLEVEQLRHEASILHESLSEKEQQTSEEMEALEVHMMVHVQWNLY